jgi:hypothetical protein
MLDSLPLVSTFSASSPPQHPTDLRGILTRLYTSPLYKNAAMAVRCGVVVDTGKSFNHHVPDARSSPSTTITEDLVLDPNRQTSMLYFNDLPYCSVVAAFLHMFKGSMWCHPVDKSLRSSRAFRSAEQSSGSLFHQVHGVIETQWLSSTSRALQTSKSVGTAVSTFRVVFSTLVLWSSYFPIVVCDSATGSTI